MLKQIYIIFKKLVIFALFFCTWRFLFIFDFHFRTIFKLRSQILCKQIKKVVPDFHSFYDMESFINPKLWEHILLRVTMSLQIISLEKFIRKGRIENLYSVQLFWDRRNVLIGLNYIELEKISTQYKHSLYKQPGITKISYSI